MGGFSCRIFNAGNTHVQIAELAGDSLRLIETVPTAEFRVEDFAVETMAAASVVPDLEERFRKAGAFIVSSRMANCPVDLSRMEHAETLGADRLANAASLMVSGSLPALCVDFGTAINLEFVDADRCMCGGAIFPGRRILRKSLHDYTAKLPVLKEKEKLELLKKSRTGDAEARKQLGIRTDRPLVVSFWGSMGAKYMNEHMAGALALGFLRHQT